MAACVLVIDDEQDLLDLLQFNLQQEGYRVLTARDGEAGLALARKQTPDAIVLDLMMPRMDGLEVCRRLRKETPTAGVPILMLTAKADEADKVVGLELGADDYLTKPFSVRELRARVKALLRRSMENTPVAEVLELGPLTINLPAHKAYAGKKELSLTFTEFAILKALALKCGKVLSRDELISDARGVDVMVSDRTIDVHVASLRKKLGKHGEWIETVRGLGYRGKE